MRRLKQKKIDAFKSEYGHIIHKINPKGEEDYGVKHFVENVKYWTIKDCVKIAFVSSV